MPTEQDLRPVRVRFTPVERPGPSAAEEGEGSPQPHRASAAAAGYDLRAWLQAPLTLQPGEWAKIGCGFSMALPSGYEAQVRPRSGLALKHGVTLLNSPGTIDADYRGEVSVILVNFGKTSFLVSPGMRIAQLVVASLCPVEWEPCVELETTQRGAGGFGSSGA